MAEIMIPELDTPFVFRSRPEAIPGDIRPMWRIGTLLLILHLASRGGKSSFGRLHVLNWAIRNRSNRLALARIVKGDVAPDAVIVRIEPSLNQAVDLAHAEGLIDRVGGNRIRLTARGDAQARILTVHATLFSAEREYLHELGKGVTEGLVRSVFAQKA